MNPAHSCPFCSLLCDDLPFEPGGGTGCLQAERGYRRALAAAVRPAAPPEALARARQMLAEARQPLLLLGLGADLQAARAALGLARALGAILVLDDGGSLGSLALAMQAEGLLGGSLGELGAHPGPRLFCGGDPAGGMPRLWEFLDPLGSQARLSLGTRASPAAVRRLRAGGRLRDTLAEAGSGVVLIGDAWLRAGVPLGRELLAWLRELNREGRWYALPLPAGANAFGLSQALQAATGFPGSLRFRPEGVEYDPFGLQAPRLLQSASVDLVLIVGQPRAQSFPVPSIQISPARPGGRREVWLHAAQPGVDAAGSMLRVDGLRVELEPCASCGVPTAAGLLEALA